MRDIHRIFHETFKRTREFHIKVCGMMGGGGGGGGGGGVNVVFVIWQTDMELVT